MNEILTCNQLQKKYRSKRAVDQVSLSIELGKIYALLGPNGSGKTTWMKMVAGLVKPTAGTLQFHGEPIGVASKKRVAYMSTEPFYYSYMTIAHVKQYHIDFFEDFDAARFDMLLDRMELKLEDKVKELSSGMAAKLKIAATLARDAELYLLDEPLNGIDIIARDHIITTIVENAKETNTIIMSSHLVDELEKIIDSAVFMKEGRIVLSGDAEQIRVERQKSIVELYKEIYA